MIYDIDYKGQTYHSKSGFDIISDEEFERIRKEWYKKPNFNDVLMEMVGLRNGGVSIPLITDYYYRELMDNTVKYFDKWSINDVLNNKLLLSVFCDKIKKNPNVFSSNNIVDNIDTAFRLGGKGIASKVSQFPVKVVDDIIYEYNANGNYYDFSCGWGARLSSAIKNGVNYFGTDPNYLLTERLNQYYKDYDKYIHTTAKCDIRTQGSEIFVPEWENKIGLAFSSPPYFLLEDYKIGNQSYKKGTSYSQWINNYMIPTFNNIYRYLINEGYFVINIKDFDKYSLEKDTIECAKKCGFELFEIKELNQAKRVSGDNNGGKNIVDVDEKVYVFNKKGYTPAQCHPVQLDLFSFIDN